MNDFNVSLKSCNCKNCNSSTDTITNVSQTISLQGNYILNVISVNNNFATILIQNGFQVIIRNVRNFPMQICIPTKGCTHIVTLTATIN